MDDCVGEYDDCGICNGPGSIYDCGCADIPEGDCDCDGNVLDECEVCGGDGSSCLGCVYIYACNYDPTATIDDGSCEFNTCAGCTDPMACNYNPTLTEDDGSCLYGTDCASVPDCTDALACNYNDSTEETDNSLCEYPAPGYNCDGSCISDVDGDGVCDGIF